MEAAKHSVSSHCVNDLGHTDEPNCFSDQAVGLVEIMLYSWYQFLHLSKRCSQTGKK